MTNYFLEKSSPKKEGLVNLSNMTKKVAIVAIGGNSLIIDQGHKTVEDQFKASVITCKHIVDMIEQGWDVVITHGNGPQVGFILLRSEISISEIHTVPLDSVGADTQGALGYMLQQNLYNELLKRNIRKNCCTVITQCIVDGDDHAFLKPTKPIGPFYSKEDAEKKRDDENWDIVEIPGKGWRRVVASPIPKRIVEMNSINDLIASGCIVIGVGGGGIPVIEKEDGSLKGVPAVIDKDRASSLLAQVLSADLLLISTDIDRAYINYGKPDETPLDNITLEDAKGYLEAGEFLPGSMGPKIEASIDYLMNGGKEVIITSPANIGKAIQGKAGTHIRG